MRRRPLYRGIALALALGLLTTPVAWSSPQRDTGAATWALGWLDQLGGWLGRVTIAIGSSEDRGAEIDPNGFGSGTAAETDGTCHDCGPEIDPNG